MTPPRLPGVNTKRVSGSVRGGTGSHHLPEIQLQRGGTGTVPCKVHAASRSIRNPHGDPGMDLRERDQLLHDGVDGLSGTLSIITIMSIYIVDRMKDVNETYSFLILLFAVCILGYLWYNATPSKLMMGDAGSRAMGLFISIAILKSGCPFFVYSVGSGADSGRRFGTA